MIKTLSLLKLNTLSALHKKIINLEREQLHFYHARSLHSLKIAEDTEKSSGMNVRSKCQQRWDSTALHWN